MVANNLYVNYLPLNKGVFKVNRGSLSLSIAVRNLLDRPALKRAFGPLYLASMSNHIGRYSATAYLYYLYILFMYYISYLFLSNIFYI